MTTRTERVMDWFLVAAFFGLAGWAGFLAFKSLCNSHLLGSLSFVTAMLLGILFGGIHLNEILIRRWAEQRMREMKKEKDENR